MADHPYDTFYTPLLLTIASVLAGVAPSLGTLPLWATVVLYVLAVALIVAAGMLAYRTRKRIVSSGRGGRGGTATTIGDGNTAVGGRGGNANGGVGGAGGNATVKGNKSVARGGDGGAG